MLEGGGDPDLAQEALGAERPGQLRPQDLEGDGALVLDVAGHVHDGHSALAQLTLDLIAVPEGRAQAFELVGHCWSKADIDKIWIDLPASQSHRRQDLREGRRPVS